MQYKKLVKLLISIIICELAGLIGSLFTIPQVSGSSGVWYKGLNKPFFNPPNWIFGPVWTIIFVLMGISLYLIWSADVKIKKAKAISIFAFQLILNALWSVIFFGMQSSGVAFFELLMLWVAIALTIIVFYRISKIAAYLLLPYILWVSFAGILNFMIWILN